MQSNFKDKHNLYVPVYDNDGNLYWPKQMIYEEVKKFIEERDKEKETEKAEEPKIEDKEEIKPKSKKRKKKTP